MKSHECGTVKKVCNTCSKEKDITKFHKNKGTKDGFLGKCKECVSEYGRNLKHTNPEVYARQLENGRKQKAKLGKEHLANSKAKWDDANREYISTYNKAQYYTDVEKSRSRVRDYRKANPEKAKTSHKNWSDNNPVKYKANKRKSHAKRRAAKVNAKVAWADEEKIKVFYTEAVRMSEETGIPHEVDHMIPLLNKDVCGLHVEYNLQVLTAKENHVKTNSFN